MTLPKIGDKLYVLLLDAKMYRIGEIKKVEVYSNYCVILTVDWIINPYYKPTVCYDLYNFETYPTFVLNSIVTVTFNEQEFVRLLNEYTEKDWPVELSKSNDY